jgi:hypothetical protein
MNKKIVAAILTVIILSIVIVYFIMNSGYFFPSRNITVLNVTPSKTNVYAGDSINLTVSIKNKGKQNETFNVSTFYNTTLLKTETITALQAGAETSLVFNWNTTNIAPANYDIKAECAAIPGESNTTDNTATNLIKIRNKPTNVTVHFDPNPKAGFVGHDVIVRINVTEVSDLYFWELELSWDPTIAEIVNATESSLLQTVGATSFGNPDIDNNQGLMYADCTLSEDIPGANGNGTLISIAFHIKTSGNCILSLQNIILMNTLGDELNITTLDEGVIQAILLPL